ncbi:hypothetical protein KR52_10220 [Synechococcus sp. KORDI-52]|nr:hypothetical protein KR52_10220 [Synechococcus sp. KORDI-52]
MQVFLSHQIIVMFIMSKLTTLPTSMTGQFGTASEKLLDHKKMQVRPRGESFLTPQPQKQKTILSVMEVD